MGQIQDLLPKQSVETPIIPDLADQNSEVQDIVVPLSHSTEEPEPELSSNASIQVSTPEPGKRKLPERLNLQLN